MRALVSYLVACSATVAACGGAAPPPTEQPEPAAEALPTVASTHAIDATLDWLSQLAVDTMLTYSVDRADAHETPVRFLVQERAQRGASIAVRLAPIGTPLGEEPVYPQWLVGSPDGLRALEEHAAFTTPGYVPIDAEGRLLTEAANSETWRVETGWLRADRSASGGEAAAGWSLRERVPQISEPTDARNCVRLERQEQPIVTTLLICMDLGLVELVRAEGARTVERWVLTRIGERPTELQ